jgi:hypothetical protein
MVIIAQENDMGYSNVSQISLLENTKKVFHEENNL